MNDEVSGGSRKQSFRDLRVWQKACDLVVGIYDLTETFPANERYELTKHMRKTVWSIPLNIAEGCARYRKNEFLFFLRVSTGSLAELETFLVIARRLGMGRQDMYPPLDNLAQAIGQMLHGLSESVRNRTD